MGPSAGNLTSIYSLDSLCSLYATGLWQQNTHTHARQTATTTTKKQAKQYYKIIQRYYTLQDALFNSPRHNPHRLFYDDFMRSRALKKRTPIDTIAVVGAKR